MTAKVISFVLSPINPLVGDNVEAHIVFKLPPDAFPPAERIAAYPAPISDDELASAYSLNFASIQSVPNSSIEALSILDSYIESTRAPSSSTQNTCTLVVRFMPWQTGIINLPPFICPLPSADSVKVLPPSVIIASVFSNGVTDEDLRPPLGPLLSPFTVHVLYASIAVAVALFAALCITATKRRAIRLWFALRKLEYKEKQNTRALRKRLAALTKSRTDDDVFCTRLQQSVRTYLGTRFGEDFSALTTKEVAAVCAIRTTPTASTTTEEAYNSLIAVMRRADYVRFSSKNASSAKLQLRERTDLIQQILCAVSML